MKIRVLGSAAGGGVPQWNCSCANCRAARTLKFPGLRRTQSSMAVSADNKNWVLFNASPDFCSQAATFRSLSPGGKKLRGTAIAAVVLTDGELDHVTGLLSLREHRKLRLVCTQTVGELLNENFSLLPVLKNYCEVRVSHFPVQIASLRISALDLGSKTPPYAPHLKRRGLVVGLRIESSQKSLAYLPGLPAITVEVEKFIAGCDCLLLDGTFWSEREMVSPGFTKRTAGDMGHVPIGGSHGTFKWLQSLKIPRKIYIHINNTNPILRNTSREHNTVARAGMEVAHDGMDIRL
ncbi:MAG: pyrroloquinoline quinone biosynthesis protein PqqB [Verrucomicrobiota bacterium]